MAINTITGNVDIDYIQRDYNSVSDAIITFANVNFGQGTDSNRLWTDFNVSSFSRNWLEIVAFTADVFFFYFDQQATQTYLQTATIRSAVRDIAKQFGYSPATASSASGNVTFTFTGPGTLNRGFKVASSSGIPFYLTNAIVAGSAGQYTGTVLQGKIVTETFTAKGLQNEEFNLRSRNVIIDETAVNPLDLTPALTVQGNEYDLVESFIRNNGTDTPAVIDSLGEIIGGGGRVFQLEERADGTPFVRFGDGIFGRKLTPGETISITYRTGGGSAGNVAAGAVTSLLDNVGFVTSVTNVANFSGGADEQTIEQLRDLIPASLRTLERAVSETDYSDLIITKFSEISAASQEINYEDPGIDLNIYVVPTGSTITAITDNSLLLNRLNNYIDRRKMVTVQFQILDAYGIQVVIALEIFISTTASKTTVTTAIQNAIINFFNLQTGGVDGSGVGFKEQILLKDINNLVQEIDGIERFEIKTLTYRPRIDKNIRGLVTDYNTSQVDIFPTVDELEYLIAASGVQTETSGSVIFGNSSAIPFSYTSESGLIQYSNPVLLSGVAPGDLFRNGPGLFEKVDVTTVGDGTGAAEIIKVTTRADEQGIQEVFTVRAVADVGSSLAGRFFIAYDQAGSVGVWINVGGSTPQPSMGTNRDIEVSISANANANTVAGAIRAAMDADSQFSATVSGTAQTTQVTTDIPSTITDGQYFLLNAANDAPQYYVYFHDNNTGSDPNVSGRTAIAVNINGDANANDVADSLRAAVDANANFSATRVNNVVTIVNSDNGPSTPAMDVNVGGTFAILTTIVGVNADTVTVTNAQKLAVSNTVDGPAPTGFTFATTVIGTNPNTLGGAYFDISDNAGPVRIWFDVDNASSAPAVPIGGRLIEINIAANNTATDVASALQSTVHSDAQFNATVASNAVTITNAAVGTRTNPTDGTTPTGFQFAVLIEGAPALTVDGTYLIVPDVNGGVAFWFDVDNNGTPEPAHGQTRSVEVTTVTNGMTAAQVAIELEKALESASPYTAELAEVSLVTTVADISSSLNNKYFTLNSANNATQYYVWYNVGGTGTDPAIAGKTPIPVAIAVNETANNIATATAAAIDALSDFTATALADEVTITNVVGGKTTDLADAITPNNTSFTFLVLVQGATFGVTRVSDVLTITASDKSTLNNPSAGTSGFTVTVTEKGVADNTDFIINAIDIPNSSLYLAANQPVNAVAGVNAGGSIRNGATDFESFKVFKRMLATATNLSVDSITDSNIDLAVQTGTGSALSARVIIDNSRVYIPGQFATGDFYLIDGAGNIWEILENNSNTITTSITAVNDASVSTVSSGEYKIVTKLVNRQVVFNGSVFNIQYNTDNTIYSAGAQFTQIGTIGDQFAVVQQQVNVGKFGTSADLVAFNSSTGEIRLNGAPNLSGINSGDTLIDSQGQTFSIVSVDNRSLPQLAYSDSNQNDNLILFGTGSGQQYAQGFKVDTTAMYSVVSANMLRQGNCIGRLIARIVLDDGTGLPDLTKLVAISNSLLVTTVNSDTYEKTVFNFTAPPTLSAGTQYHLVISGDVSYSASQKDGVIVFNNVGPVAYTYNTLSGVISYASAVNLASVVPGNFIEDTVGDFYQIVAVDDANNTVTVAAGLPLVAGSSNGSIVANDSIRIAIDSLAPTYTDGEMARFDGIEWSNSTQGGDQFPSAYDMIFSAEGPKTIVVESNLTPVLGPGATISTRYYDDENQISFIIGLSTGTVTSAADVNALGRGTVGGIPNTPVDSFVLRTSRIADDIINLRAEEIPQINPEDITINIFGGVD